MAEKLEMLVNNQLWSPIDIFDLLMHGSPWIWLAWSAFTLLRLLNLKEARPS